MCRPFVMIGHAWERSEQSFFSFEREGVKAGKSIEEIKILRSAMLEGMRSGLGLKEPFGKTQQNFAAALFKNSLTMPLPHQTAGRKARHAGCFG